MKYFMIVILQKISKALIIFVLFLPIGLKAQTDECNRETTYQIGMKYIPKEVCIPYGYAISYIYGTFRPIDFNRDGLNDCVFVVSKRNEVLGDTSLLYFYKQNPDTTYSFLRKYDNVFPIYFNYDLSSSDIEDERLVDILYNCYNKTEPLLSIDFKQDTIILKTVIEHHKYYWAGYKYKFKFTNDNWKLTNKEYYDSDKSYDIEIKDTIYLDEFTYCKKK